MKLVLAALVAVLCACGNDEVIPIDAPTPIDATVDTPPVDAIDATLIDADLRCGACTATQICVQFWNGTCGDGHIECQERGTGCVGNACSPECQFWHCGAADAGTPYQCGVASCPGDTPGALHCYGP